MAKGVRFRPRSAGYVEIMQSGEVASLCHELAEEVADRARGSLPAPEEDWRNEPYYVNDRITEDRALSTVTTGNPDSMRAERKTRNLKKAL